jgi:hypothetical protein
MSQPTHTVSPKPIVDPDAMELSPGFAHENLEGWLPDLASDEELRMALEKAFDYRGDVTITRKDGSKVEGYIFDRRSGSSLEDSVVRLYPVNSKERLSVPYADVARLEFTGKDRAAGKHWEAWVKQYNEKKAAGERNIALVPDSLE